MTTKENYNSDKNLSDYTVSDESMTESPLKKEDDKIEEIIEKSENKTPNIHYKNNKPFRNIIIGSIVNNE